MFKRLRNWLFGPEITEPNDPAYDVYPDIIADVSVEDIMRRLGISEDIVDDEDDTANFDYMMDELGGEG